MSMNLRGKFIRLVIASAVGSLLWAGCATSNRVVVHDPAGAEPGTEWTDRSAPFMTTADREAIAAAPVDQLKRRPDTHPELRSGLWQTAFQEFRVQAPVVEAPVVDLPAETTPPSVDSDYLLKFDPEAINIAEATQNGGIITEAAGAQTPRRWPQKEC